VQLHSLQLALDRLRLKRLSSEHFLGPSTTIAASMYHGKCLHSTVRYVTVPGMQMTVQHLCRKK
jgi:hypothetical protein